MKRGKALQAGESKLKRSRLNPRSKKRAAAVADPGEDELAGRLAWHQATLFDPGCKPCGRGRHVHGHHVVRAQDVRKAGGNVWDLRNRLSVCTECHLNHHHGSHRQRIAFEELMPENVEFARELFGDDTLAYFARHYRGLETEALEV